QAYFQDLIGGRVVVSEARFSPFEGIHLSRVWITESNEPTVKQERPPGPKETVPPSLDVGGTAPIADGVVFSCSDIHLKHRLGPMLLGRLLVSTIVATRPTLTIYRDTRSGRYNVSDLIRNRRKSPSGSPGTLPAIRLRSARVRLGRVDGAGREIVEDLRLDVLATPQPAPGVYELSWQGGGVSHARGRSRLDLNTSTLTDLEGGLPSLSLEGAFLAADAEVRGAQPWCDLLGLTGQLRVSDFHVSASGPESDQPRASINLSHAALSIPLDEAEKDLPLDRRYLRLTDVSGRLDFGAQEATVTLEGLLHGAACRLDVRLSYPGDDTPSLAEVGFEAEVSVQGLRLPRRDDPAAPQQTRFIQRWRPVRSFYNDFDPGGSVNLRLSVAKSVGADAPIELRDGFMEGVNCNASYRLFPYRVDGITGRVEFQPDGIVLNKLTGTHAGGRVTVDGRLKEARWYAQADLQIAGRDIVIDSALREALSDQHRRICDRFALRGRADVNVDMHREQGTADESHSWETTVGIDFRDAAGRFDGFPYPLEGVHGRVEVSSGRLTVSDLEASAGTGSVVFNGSAQFASGGTDSLALDLVADGIAFDDRLYGALPDEVRRQVASFHPRGAFDLAGNVGLDPADGALTFDVQADLVDVAVTPDAFPIPVEEVTGLLRLTPGRVVVDGLQGRYASGRIVADGTLEGGLGDRRIDLTITTNDLVIDPDLRRHLPPEVNAAWRGFEVAGPVDTVSTVQTVDQQPSSGTEIETMVTAKGLTVRHERFAAPVSELVGTIGLRSGRIELSGVEGRWGEAIGTVEGYVVRGDEAVEGRLSLLVKQVPFSEALRQELPWRLRRAWNILRPLGRFTLDLPRLEFRLPADGVDPHWEFEGALQLHDAGFDAGLRLRHLDGRLSGSGRIDPGGDGLSVAAEVDLKEVEVNDRRITGLTGRLARSGASGQLVLSDLRGRICGGAVQAAVQLDQAVTPNRYACNANLTRVKLDEFLAAGREDQTARPEGEGDQGGSPNGHLNARLHLSGQTGDRESVRGGGRVGLEEARLFRLPLMLSILDVLGLAAPGGGGDLQSATAEFFVLGPQVQLRDILIQGNTVAMVGAGTLDRHPTQMDLRLVAVSPHRWFRLPVLTEFLEGASRELVEIRVRGGLSEPGINAAPLPTLGGALETLLGTPLQSRSDRPGNGS
ncbi:MAG: hypothetical protein GY778_10715, partial [bacterium]|nr:hypothetical protein [bacterium]